MKSMVIGEEKSAEGQNTQDWKIYQNEHVEIAISCVLVSTHSGLSVFVLYLCPAKETEKNICLSFLEKLLICCV